MIIKVIGSGSSGNGYLISDGHSQLIIECGISFKKFQTAVEFELGNLDGILISHEHRDHCKYISYYLHGTYADVYATKGTIDAMFQDRFLRLKTIEKYRFQHLQYKRPVEIGNWKVTAFETQHDVAEPCGFLIDNLKTKERLLFATDTYYVKYRFTDVTHIMIEANYDKQVIDETMTQGFDLKRKTRLLESHMSIENTLDFIKANKSDKLKEIYLLHLSDSNSRAAEFRYRAQRITGVPVYIA